MLPCSRTGMTVSWYLPVPIPVLGQTGRRISHRPSDSRALRNRGKSNLSQVRQRPLSYTIPAASARPGFCPTIDLFLRILHRLRLSFRQGNALGFLRHDAHAVVFPVFPGLLDAIARAGDEVPPDEAVGIHGLAAEVEQAGRGV